jgi:hypothetical protein
VYTIDFIVLPGLGIDVILGIKWMSDKEFLSIPLLELLC